MIFENEASFYEILEIRPDASSQDVRNAYLRLKASYRKDNPALYSVLDPSETEDMIQKIEEAFQILSDPDARREYDERNGFADRIERKIFAIDRGPPASAPPMEGGGDDDLLVAPATDFEGMSNRGENPTTGSRPFSLPTQPTRESASFLDTLPPAERASTPAVKTPFSDGPGLVDRRSSDRGAFPATSTPIDPVAAEIANETEWRGSTLRKVRELRRYSLDDIAALTKISKNHLLAIEEEAFGKLPAPVFVRGFLLQFARTLKIPPEPVAIAYLARFTKRPGSV